MYIFVIATKINRFCQHSVPTMHYISAIKVQNFK